MDKDYKLAEHLIKHLQQDDVLAPMVCPTVWDDQDQVDAKFAEVEALYNNYVSQKTSLSAAARQTRENAILNKEKEAQEYQESLFGQEGTLMKKRIEVISPIQKQVFDAIEAYAKQAGADLVLDSANNPTLLYTNPSVERTQQVIDALKK